MVSYHTYKCSKLKILHTRLQIKFLDHYKYKFCYYKKKAPKDL